MKHQPILYVEDDENDVSLVHHVFKAAEIPNPIHVVADGQQAMTYLAGAAMLRSSEVSLFPCLVLLDLQLPGIPGFEVLEWIRAQPALTTLVVIVLSSSENPRDVARAYRLRANSYVCKPPSLAKRLEFARLLKAWWLECNQLPPWDGVSPPGPAARVMNHVRRQPGGSSATDASKLGSSDALQPNQVAIALAADDGQRTP